MAVAVVVVMVDHRWSIHRFFRSVGESGSLCSLGQRGRLRAGSPIGRGGGEGGSVVVVVVVAVVVVVVVVTVFQGITGHMVTEIVVAVVEVVVFVVVVVVAVVVVAVV